jgi:hypothetical protein
MNAAVVSHSERGSESRNEGTAVHKLAENLINAMLSALEPTSNQLVGTEVEGVIVTKDMYERAKIYADDVISQCRKYRVFSHAAIGIERTFKIPSVHEVNFGTPDLYLFVKKEYRLIIWDYKDGFVNVEAFYNWQMINYLAGILDEFNFDDTRLTVEFRVVQPRSYSNGGAIDSWVFIGSNVRSNINMLNLAAKENMSGTAKTKTGSHCKYCSARLKCKSAIDAGLQLYEATNSPTVANMTPEQLGTMLSIIKRAKDHINSMETAYDEEVKYLLRSGKLVPGFKLQQSKGRRRWNCEPELIKSIGQAVGVNVFKSDPFITPKQAIDAGIPEEVILNYSEVPNGEIKLAVNNINKARKVFYE